MDQSKAAKLSKLQERLKGAKKVQSGGEKTHSPKQVQSGGEKTRSPYDFPGVDGKAKTAPEKSTDLPKYKEVRKEAQPDLRMTEKTPTKKASPPARGNKTVIKTSHKEAARSEDKKSNRRSPSRNPETEEEEVEEEEDEKEKEEEKEEEGGETDEETKSGDATKTIEESKNEKLDRPILDYAKENGRLPCVLWRKETPTFCYENLGSKKYTVVGETEELSATDLIQLYGPRRAGDKCKEHAIHVVKYLGEEKTTSPDADPDAHWSHGEWHRAYEDEMAAIRAHFKQKKSVTTAKKRRHTEDSGRSTSTALAKRGALVNWPPSDGTKGDSDSVMTLARARTEPVSRVTGVFTKEFTKEFLKLDPDVQKAVVQGDTQTRSLQLIHDMFFKK